ncbi:Gfo/Idh/MocA family oxidoreductase [Microterricola viridarii]|uniref:Oxidoreductase family, NAD-binding Rossmann fold n=1 Tax=Microterricola viridarii TaxID=412690 RepID=A0A1H1T3E7_9MICO|nr:Gfo/Idh/MocA family oxidoreductase [Microterricola viridarii]SDS54169.1 Oxidoreductase family, NAD-binding Rossmann fold [Microterricola viridarii]
MPADSRIVFAIVGSGWRAEFYLRVAQALPNRFEVCGVVARTEERRAEIVGSWHVPAFATIDDLLRARTPDFVVVAVVRPAAPGIVEDLAGRGVPVLGETPPAADMPALERLHQLNRRGSRIQVAEQYHLQPMLLAQLAIAKSGELGMVSQASLSICHDHHAVSLVRKFLDVGFENALITANEFVSPLVAGPDKVGDPDEERIVKSSRVTARLEYDGRLGLIDFAKEQYFSWIRANRLQVRGDRGEITDERVASLTDFRTPSWYPIERVDLGHGTNLEGLTLRGLMARGRWVYTNDFAPARLTDDELAIASCLVKMFEYAGGGDSFYGLAEAAQDQYTNLVIRRSITEKRAIRMTKQVWAPSF